MKNRRASYAVGALLLLMASSVFAWKYPSSCKDCKTTKRIVSGYPVVTVQCRCRNDEGNYVSSSLVMKRRGYKCFVISNYHGKLICSPASPQFHGVPRCRHFTKEVLTQLNRFNARSHCRAACASMRAKWVGKWYLHADQGASMCVCRRCGQ